MPNAKQATVEFPERFPGEAKQEQGDMHVAIGTSLRAEEAVAHAVVAPFDGERFTPPVFDMGVAPAIGAYSSLNDLARFAQAALGREAGSLGGEFFRGKLDEHDVASISGGVYGFTNDLSLFRGITEDARRISRYLSLRRRR